MNNQSQSALTLTLGHRPKVGRERDQRNPSPPLANRSDRGSVGEREEHDRPGDVRPTGLPAARWPRIGPWSTDWASGRSEITRLFTAVGFPRRRAG